MMRGPKEKVESEISRKRNITTTRCILGRIRHTRGIP